MGDKSKIEWCEATWNPIIGCSKVSSGCDNCYAERMAGRFCQTGGYYNGVVIPTRVLSQKYMWTGKTEFKAHKLYEPLHWRKPRTVFVCSMGDLFHESVRRVLRTDKVMSVIAMAEQHRFMILTKRPKRMLEYFEYSNLPAYIMTQLDMWHEHDPKHDDLAIEAAAKIGCYNNWPLDNLAIGVSVEDQQTADERIPILLQTPAARRFVSYEPALGPVDFSRWLNAGIDLVIMGGESGPSARPMHPEWARSVRDQCEAAGVPFHFKQWGEWHPEPLGFSEQRQAELKHLCWVTPDGRFSDVGIGRKEDDSLLMFRVSKKRAGRLLDGQEHNGQIRWR